MQLADLLAAYDAADDRAGFLWALPDAEGEALARSLARRHVARVPAVREPAPLLAPPPGRALPDYGAEGVMLLLAALVERARVDAERDAGARVWLEELEGHARAQRPRRFRVLAVAAD